MTNSDRRQTSTDTFDAVIIGGGILGCSIALELTRRKKLNVCVVEKLREVGQGSTAWCCGIVRTHYSTEPGVTLGNESIRYWQNWADHLGARDPLGLCEYRQVGGLYLMKPGWDIPKKIISLMEQVGVLHEVLTPEQLRKTYPFLDLSKMSPVRRPDDPAFFECDSETTVEGGIFETESGYVPDPALSVHNIAHAAMTRGVTIRTRVTAVGILRRGDRVRGVRLESGDVIEAPIVVNAAGPHSSFVNRMAGVEIPLTVRPIRHEVSFIPAPPGFDLSKLPVLSDADSGSYCRPVPPNRILIGSEDPECDPHEYVDDADRVHDEPSGAQFDAQVMRLMKRIPALRKGPADGFGALYDTTTDDWYPIFDRSDLDGFYLAMGTSGGWFKGGAPIGYLMADLIDRVENGQDHDEDPVRVRLPYSGREIDLSFFSRNRAPHRTSMSVTG